MKIIFLLLHSFFCFHLCAQDFVYPKLSASGKSLNDMVPVNWFIKDSAVGDLNGDKLPDLAFVLEYKDTIPEKRPGGELNEGSPRILAVYFKEARAGSYRLFVQNNTFIIRYGEGGMDPEAYGKISIDKGILQVVVSFLRGHAAYKFRFQKGDLFLVCASTGGVSGGNLYGFDVNFSTGKAKIEERKMEDDKNNVKWVTINKTPLRRLRDMKQIFEWEVVKDHHI